MEKRSDPRGKQKRREESPSSSSSSLSLIPDDGLAVGWPFVSASTLQMQTDLGCHMQMKAPDGAPHRIPALGPLLNAPGDAVETRLKQSVHCVWQWFLTSLACDPLK